MELGVSGRGERVGRLSPQQVTELVTWGSVPPSSARGPRLSPCWLLQSLEWGTQGGAGLRMAGRVGAETQVTPGNLGGSWC